MKRGLIEFLCVALPKILGGVCTIGLNLILLRHLDVEDFGIYSLCVAGILLADAIVGSAIDLGVMRLAPMHRLTDPERSLSIEKSAFYIKLCMVGALSIMLGLWAGPLGRIVFHRSGDANLIWIACGGAMSMLMLRSALAHLQVSRRFGLYGLFDLIHAVLKFGGIAVLLVLFPGHVSPGSLLTFFMIGPVAVFLVFLATEGRVFFRRFACQRQAAVELLGFVKWFLLTFAVTSTVARLDVFLITFLTDIHEVGIFSGGYIFTLIPELLGSYMAVVLSPRVMPYLREGRFCSFFQKFQSACIVGAIGIYIAALCMMGWIGQYLLPEDFARSSHIILILLPGALAAMITFPLTISFLMFVRPNFLLKLEIATLPFMAVAYGWAIPTHGAVGAAMVTSGFRVFKAAVSQRVAWKLARQARDEGPSCSDVQPNAVDDVLPVPSASQSS